MKFKMNKQLKELMEKYAEPKGKKIKAIGIVAFDADDDVIAFTKAAAILKKVPECGNIDFIVDDVFVGCAQRCGNAVVYRRESESNIAS